MLSDPHVPIRNFGFIADARVSRKAEKASPIFARLLYFDRPRDPKLSLNQAMQSETRTSPHTCISFRTLA